VTAIPVWSENRKLVPAVFLTGALGSATGILELLGFLIPATQFIGIVASIVETAIAITIEVRGRYVDRPLREGPVGWLTRAGAFLAGPTRPYYVGFSGQTAPGLAMQRHVFL
jgi:hypothetical protein